MEYDDKDVRLAEFEKAFGPIEKIEAEFITYMEKSVR